MIGRYSTGAIILHWLIALALAFQLALGFTMPKGPNGFALFQLHKSIGIAILLLTLIRIGWRITHRPPPALEKGAPALLAKLVHLGLYAFMLLGPLTGWVLVSTGRVVVPTMLFGAIPWPHLPVPNGWHEPFEEAHELIAWIGIALFLLHVAGAIRHQIMLKDNVMGRMAPGGKALWAWILLACAVALYFGSGSYLANKYPREERVQPAETESESARAPLEAEASPASPETPTEEATPEAGSTEQVAEAQEAAAADQPGPPPVWAIAPGGRLAFSVGNGRDTISGSFKKWGGSIKFDPENPESADIRIDVDLASASVGDATQDGMLQGEEYFNSGSAGKATYRAASARKTGTNAYAASGTLTLKGASKPQTIRFRLNGSGMKRHVEGSASIARAPFDIGMGGSGGDLSPNVDVNFAFDATGKPGQ